MITKIGEDAVSPRSSGWVSIDERSGPKRDKIRAMLEGSALGAMLGMPIGLLASKSPSKKVQASAFLGMLGSMPAGALLALRKAYEDEKPRRTVHKHVRVDLGDKELAPYAKYIKE